VQGLDDPKSDPYATLSIANIMYYNTFKEKDKGRSSMDEKTRARIKEHLDQALAYYTKVLQTHPDNIYAANGVGAILAEQGKVDQAKEVFVTVQVRRPSPSLTSFT
jgi:RNA polymerase-associated protein CTR9